MCQLQDINTANIFETEYRHVIFLRYKLRLHKNSKNCQKARFFFAWTQGFIIFYTHVFFEQMVIDLYFRAFLFSWTRP